MRSMRCQWRNPSVDGERVTLRENNSINHSEPNWPWSVDWVAVEWQLPVNSTVSVEVIPRRVIWSQTDRNKGRGKNLIALAINYSALLAESEQISSQLGLNMMHSSVLTEDKRAKTRGQPYSFSLIGLNMDTGRYSNSHKSYWRGQVWVK
jgi:hypothetical protein